MSGDKFKLEISNEQLNEPLLQGLHHKAITLPGNFASVLFNQFMHNCGLTMMLGRKTITMKFLVTSQLKAFACHPHYQEETHHASKIRCKIPHLLPPGSKFI